MKNVLIFAVGAAIGSVVTWKAVEKYYKKLADEEIASVTEVFKKRIKEESKNKKAEVENNKEETETEIEIEIKPNDIDDHKELIQSLNYGESKMSKINQIEEQLINPSPEDTANILILDPNDFGEEDEFDTKSWMYWHDGVLTNEFDEIVEDPTSFIGDALSHFGDYEEDSVYVRNKAMQADIEILLSEKDFNE